MTDERVSTPVMRFHSNLEAIMDTRDEMAAIREIQENLQILYKDGYSLPYVGVDGIYGDATADAVSDFQYAVGIEPTGVVDVDTWTALVAAARQAQVRADESAAIKPFERRLQNNEIKMGEISDLVTIIQLMLKTLTEYEYGEVVADGFYGDVTENAIIDFQRRNGLEPTGVVDKITWNALARAYNKYVSYDH